jgi:RND family efflux transporter MFP subunit
MSNHVTLSFAPYAGLCLLLAACGSRSETPGPTLPLVKVIEPSGGGAEVLELRGSVAPRGRMKLGFKLAGVIASIRVREGEWVQAGQILAVLDGVDASAQASTARAALDRARREAEQAERLAQEGILPRNQRDDARNQLEICEAIWRQAQDGMTRIRLTSPVSGTVFQRLAEPGETISAGTPVLEVDTTDQLVVRTGVCERDLKRLAVGQEVELIPEDGAAPFPGSVKHLGGSPNASDGLYLVEIAPSRRDLRSGSLLRIRLSCPGDKGLRIPYAALIRRMERDCVFVLNADGKRVLIRPVRVAKADGRSVLVEQGLKAGERVVAEGAFFLEDGQAVRILE